MAKEGGSKKVMVAIDESDCSHYALEWTLDFLQETIAKSLFLIFTAQPDTNFTSISAATYGVGPIGNLYVSTTPELFKSIQDQQRKVTSALLEKAKEICASRGAWVSYKEPNWITAVLWIVLLVCFGSIATCAFIVVQLFKFSFQDPSQDPMSCILIRNHSKDDIERKTKFSYVVAARFLFTALGCLMLGTLIYTILTDGSPFHGELLTPYT